MSRGCSPGETIKRGVFLAGACAVAALVVSVPSALAADQVKITAAGSAFSGTDVNTGSTTHTAITVGTDGGASNPITSFTFDGQSCQVYPSYGSAACSVDFPPGATATFSGTTKIPAASFDYCTWDSGGTNTSCSTIDVSTHACAPAGLLAAFDSLDKNLSAVIGRVHAGKLSGPKLVHAINGLAAEKRSLIKSGFAGQTVFGVGVGVVIAGFDDIEGLLDSAELGPDQRYRIIGDLEDTGKAGQQLEKEFEAAGKAPGDLLQSFAAFDKRVAALLVRTKHQPLSPQKFRDEIRQLRAEVAKTATLLKEQKLFGVGLDDVIVHFDGIDYYLDLAKAQDGGDRHIAGDLESAEKVKQQLERDFHSCS